MITPVKYKLRRTSVYVDQILFIKLRKKLLDKNLSFGSWLRKKMQEEIEKEDNASRNS